MRTLPFRVCAKTKIERFMLKHTIYPYTEFETTCYAVLNLPIAYNKHSRSDKLLKLHRRIYHIIIYLLNPNFNKQKFSCDYTKEV